MTIAIHIKDAPPGWVGNNQYVYVGRPSIYGNPFTHIKSKTTLAEYLVETREEAVQKFKQYFYERLLTDIDFKEKVTTLKDKRLVCFCHPAVCHGNVIAKYLDGQNEKT